MILLGTFVNVATIAVGALLGWLLSSVLEKSPRLRNVPNAAMKAVSIVVLVVGVGGAIKSEKPMVLLISMVVGTIIGTIIDIDGLLDRFGKWVERKFIKKKASDGIKEEEGMVEKGFSKAFVATTLTCLVGALSITGALESGLEGNHNTLYMKSVLDLVTAFVFSSSYGFWGTIASVVPVLIYQGAITLGASALSGFLAGSIAEISAVGSLIVCALGLNMLGATKIKIANMLPAVFLPILLCLFM